MVSSHKTLANPIVSPSFALVSFETLAFRRDLAEAKKEVTTEANFFIRDIISLKRSGLTCDIGDDIQIFLSSKCS